tara:strand:- start:1257 stop:1568 length:312 start_codon:yes stop_codon:yes gene_type:complete
MSQQTPRFRTDEGDYDVSLFSDEGKLKFKLAQKAVTELSDLSDRVMIQREALQSLRQSIMDNECTDDTLIKPERARTATGQYKSDDPSTPDVNEAYVQPDKED